MSDSGRVRSRKTYSTLDQLGSDRVRKKIFKLGSGQKKKFQARVGSGHKKFTNSEFHIRKAAILHEIMISLFRILTEYV